MIRTNYIDAKTNETKMKNFLSKKIFKKKFNSTKNRSRLVIFDYLQNKIV